MEWLFYFFVYCFLGWCFESAYVSLATRRPVNRGFMKGPFLPIYGCGALAILLVIRPVRTKPAAIFIFGLCTASVLEYVAGVVMERLFKVRYWDYSQKRFQLNGHICLSSSLAWGVLSLLLQFFIHVRIERLYDALPVLFSRILLLLTAAVFILDFVTSLRSAFSLRRLLEQDARLQREIESLRARVSELEARYDQMHTSLSARLAELRRAIEEKRFTLNAHLPHPDTLPEELRDDLTRFSRHTADVLDHLRRLAEKNDLRHLLRRNPGAVSARYAASLERIRLYIKEQEAHMRRKKDR